MNPANPIVLNQLDTKLKEADFTISKNDELNRFEFVATLPDGTAQTLKNTNGVVYFTCDQEAQSELNVIKCWKKQSLNYDKVCDGLIATICGGQTSIVGRYDETRFQWSLAHVHIDPKLEETNAQLHSLCREIDAVLIQLSDTINEAETNYYTKFPEQKTERKNTKVAVVCYTGMVNVESEHIFYGNIKGMYKTGDGHGVQFSSEVFEQKMPLTAMLNKLSGLCYQLEDTIKSGLGLEIYEPFK